MATGAATASRLVAILGGVEVAILGPLRLTIDGTQQTVPPGRQPALLAMLALHADRVVSVDRLVDVVWGDALPADPANALQGRISQLRKIVGRQAIAQEAAGYRLRLDPSSVDAHRFEELARQGHDRLAAGDAHGAERVLDQALGLWRGSALAEFADEPWARAESGRLEEWRLGAVEDRLEASLALGRPAAVLPELESALAQHPLRERLRRLLMLALYRVGRQADALEVYESGRRILGEELGLDPGPDLRELQHDILTQADHLTLDRAEPARQRLSNLPARLTSFVGRGDHVAQLRSLLEGSRLVTLVGPGGAGKSRLAVETAEGAEQPDGVWLVELAGVADPDDVVATVADALDLPGSADLLAGSRDQTAQLVAALRPRRLLVVLDSCEHVIDAAARLASQLLAGCPDLTVLATSREPLGVTGEVTWSVPSLAAPVDDTVEAVRTAPAAQLFVERLVSHQPGFELDGMSAPGVAAICRRLDGIPLALELAAARGRVLGVDDIAAGLDDRFGLLVGGDRALLPRHRTLQAVIDWSWELLDDDHRMALAVLSVFAGRFTLADAERLLDATGAAATSARQLVTGLAERSLLEPDGQRTVRFRMLETIREYAEQRLEADRLARSPQAAHAELFAEKVDRLHPEDPTHWDLDLRLVEDMLDDIRTALRHAAGSGDTATMQRLAGPLGWCWWLRGRRDEGIRWLEPAMADTVVDERAALWAAFLLLARSHPGVDEWLEAASRSSAPTVALLADGFAGLRLAGLGDPDAGAEHLRGTADRARTLGGWPHASALLLSGIAELGRGQVHDAAAAVADADRLFERSGAWWGQLLASDALASIAQIRGDYREAIDRRERAIRHAERSGMTEAEIVQAIHLGNLAALEHDHVRAQGFHQRALRSAERSGNPSLVAFASNGSGLGARRRGDFAAAEQHHGRAAELYDELEEWGGAAFAYASLGFLHEQRGDHQAALHAHRTGLDRADQTGDPRAVALALEGIAGALVPSQPERAARLLGAAEQARADLGTPVPGPERFDVDRIHGHLTTALQGGARTLVAEGRSWSIDDARKLAEG